MPLLLHSLIVLFSTFVRSFAQQQHQYRQPAPAYIIQPDPTAYLNWRPDNPGHGNFRDKNSSVTPWTPNPLQQPAEYLRPEICGIENPGAQVGFWLEKIKHEGTSPFLVNGEEYNVFRNVRDFGAVGDGETDDTDAFNRAIADQSRMGGGKGGGGSTGQPALIYVPSGVYLISSSIQLFIGTQIIGDPIDPPTIKASGVARNHTVVIDGYDFGQPSTTNFYLGVRNIKIDTTAVRSDFTIYGLNWAVSQATNLMNVEFVMPVDSQHIGLEMDGDGSGGGSGLYFGDLTFTGGLVGILFSNQQYAISRCTFRDVGTAIAIRHAFVVTLQQIECENVGICVDMGGIDVSGSVSLIDSSCEGCGVVVNGTSSVLLENIAVKNSGPTLKLNGVNRGIGDLTGKTYASGHVYREAGMPIASNGSFLTYTDRGRLTRADGRYFVKKQPQYLDYPASTFASIKNAGARGDGVTDDTAAIQQALLSNADCKITYFPHGIYLVTDTIYIPPGSRIVGEVWSTITASGDKFKDETNPLPMIQIGKPGERGVVEVSDLLFTVADVLPGAILVEVNMAGSQPGDVSFHNTHYRVGGAADSLVETACQTISEPCKAAFVVLHLKETSSTYIENSWLWTADHDLDGEYIQQIGTGRGMYIQSQQPTWLIGTGSEHHTLYAYQFHNARNVFASLLQVETPYWQPLPRAPLPWTPNTTWHDPDFSSCGAGQGNDLSQCYMSWALRILGEETATLALYGQGFWTFFNGPNYGACDGPGGICQINAVEFADEVVEGSGVEVYNLNTKGVQNLITLAAGGSSNGTVVATQESSPGSWGGLITAFLGFQ